MSESDRAVQLLASYNHEQRSYPRLSKKDLLIAQLQQAHPLNLTFKLQSYAISVQSR